MFDILSYHEATSLNDAITALVKNPKAKLIAGGTDILLHIREGKLPEAELISLHNIAELKGIELLKDNSILIKPLTTFNAVSKHAITIKYLPFLSEALLTVGGPQTRNAGTIGGNICSGAPSADSAPMLLCLNAKLILTSPQGNRKISLHNFYLGPKKVDLRANEILTGIVIESTDYVDFSGHYIKFAMRKAMDIATLGCAITLKLKNEYINDFRLAFGVAAPTPIRCPQTEMKIIGQKLSPNLLELLKESVLTEVNPRSSWRASREYRLQLVKELSIRGLLKVYERAGGTLI